MSLVSSVTPGNSQSPSNLPQGIQPARGSPFSLRHEFLVVLVLALIGLALRVLWLDHIPPGIHLDEAVDGFLARDILNGARPIFFPSWGGREPLYMYLTAGIFALMGASTLALRVTSALIGAATIPVIWLLARRLFSPRVGLLAAAVLAVNYLHLTISRNGYPNILIPPLTGLSFYFLWRGYWADADRGGDRVRLKSTLNWLLGGAFGGLALYTYMASRFYPVALAVMVVYLLLVDFQHLRRSLPGFAIAILSFAVVVGPLAWHFYQNPHDLWERANQVSMFTQATPGQIPGLIAANIYRTFLGFFWPGAGDPRWHYNYSGRPILDAALAMALLLGILLCLRRWRRPPYPLMLLWFLVAWLPGVLTLDLQPATQRMSGDLYPAMIILVALGLDLAWTWLERLPLHRAPGYAPIALAAALLIFELFSTAQTYFVAWAHNAGTYQAYMGDMVDLAQAANRAQARGDQIVLISEQYKHPTVVWESPAAFDMRWIDNHAIVYPSGNSAYVAYLFPLQNAPPEGPVLTQIQSFGLPIEALAHDPAGAPSIGEVRLPRQEMPVTLVASRPTFNGEVALVDSRVPVSITREGTLQVMVQLAALRPVSGPRGLAAHLVDAQGQVWAQGDHMSYLSEQWHAGDQWQQWLSFKLDPAMPPGTYTIRLYLTDDSSHQPLPVRDSGGRLIGVDLSAGTVQVQPQGGLIRPITSAGQPVVEGLKILDSHALFPSVAPGGQFPLEITWQATDQSRSDSDVQLQLQGANGQVWEQQTVPILSAYPPSAWRPGEVIRAQYVLAIPATAPGGHSQVRVQIGQSAPLTVGQVDIAGIARQFSVPAIQHLANFTLGDSIEFAGYDLPRDHLAPGQTVDVTLYWHATASIPRDLKVFTHLMSGPNQIVAQQDSIPVGGSRPTTGWEPGEFISDPYHISLPANLASGHYTLEVGLYDAQALDRLPVRDASGAPVPDDRIVLQEIQVGP